jgi:hypothetical protein
MTDTLAVLDHCLAEHGDTMAMPMVVVERGTRR